MHEQESMKIFVDVRLVVVTLNKLEALKDVVDAVTKDEFRNFIKQKNIYAYWWLSNVIVLKRLMSVHSQIVISLSFPSEPPGP